MKTYQALNNSLDALFKLINLLVPNSISGDIDWLEENIEDIEATYKKATLLKIFGRLEDLLFEAGEEKTKELLKRILINFEDNKHSWDEYYNRKTFLKAEHSVFLYRSDKLKMIIYKTKSLILNTLYEIRNFNNHYFKSEIQSQLLDKLNDSETSIKARIIIENLEENRIEKLGFGFIEEKIIKYINELLSIEIDFKGGWGDFNSQIILSKYESGDENFPKFEDSLNLDFCMFESKEAQCYEKLKIAKEEIILDFQNETEEVQQLTIIRVEAIWSYLLHALDKFTIGHQAFIKDEISTADLWAKLESLIQFPENDKVFIAVDYIPYLAFAIIKRKEIIRELLVKLRTINIRHDLKGNKDEPMELVPIFSENIIDTVFGILKDYFNKNDHSKLKELLSKGYSPGKPIVFRSKGNLLLDAFKKLFESHFINGIEKKDLQKWIRRNFLFVKRGNETDFSEDYLEKCISRNGFTSKDNIIQIENGEITKSSEPFTKTINKY